MQNDQNSQEAATIRTIPKITLPPLEPPSMEEIERRRALLERARRLREEIGPIGIASDDLLHLARAEAER